MVAVIAGSGLGLERSSAYVLGSRGTLGQASFGRAGENVYVNAATGNLVISNVDEMLIGRGEDARVARTYNSLGQLTDENQDNWITGLGRRLFGLTGTANTAGSKIYRTDWDGSEALYTYDAAKAAYVSTEGGGAYDTITFSGGVWGWKDGDTGVVEAYDPANGNRLQTVTDRDGNIQSYAYNSAGRPTRITNADGGYTELVWGGANGNLLAQLVSYKPDGSSALTRVRYTYDSLDRLSTVTVDLTPSDNSIADGKTYVTTYTYDGTSKRIASISQTDGSRLDITYTLVGSDYRVASLSQTVSAGVTRTTTFAYDTTQRKTVVTDASDTGTIGATTLIYTQEGQLLRVSGPSAGDGTPHYLSVDFQYNSSGDVTLVNQGGGNITAYTYDANGNCILERDPVGNGVARTYSSDNKLLTETRGRVVAAPNGPTVLAFENTSGVFTFRLPDGAQAPGFFDYTPSTGGKLLGLGDLNGDGKTDWIFSAPSYPNNLQIRSGGYQGGVEGYGVDWSVVALGDFDGDGNDDILFRKGEEYAYKRMMGVTPLGSHYIGPATGFSLVGVGDINGDGKDDILLQNPAGGAVTAWMMGSAGVASTLTISGIAAGSTVVAVGDLNGNGKADLILKNGSMISSALLDGNVVVGGGDIGEVSAGWSVSGLADANADGLMDIIFRHTDNTVAYWYMQNNVVGGWSTLAPSARGALAGVYQGALVSTVEGTTTRYVYNAQGHIRFALSPTGQVTEYRYNSYGQLSTTITYPAQAYSLSGLSQTQTPSESQLIAWVDGLANKSTTTRTDAYYDFRGNLATTISYGQTLADGSGDAAASSEITRTEYIYDQTGRLLSRQIVGASGSEVFVYDGLGRRIAATDFTGQSTTTAFQDASSTTVITLANGLTQTAVYDKTGALLTYTQSGAGVSTSTVQYEYDTVGRLRIVTDATGLKTRFLYDNLGRKTGEIDPNGTLTEYRYDTQNRLVRTIRYVTELTASQAVTMNPIQYTRPAAQHFDVNEWNIYDQAGRLVQTIGNDGAVVNYTYDRQSQLISATRFITLLDYTTRTNLMASTSTPTAPFAVTATPLDRTTRYYYDADGKLVGTLDGEGFLTRTLYDNAGRKIRTIAYSNRAAYALRPSGTLAQLIASIDPAATDIHNWFLYDNRGLLMAAIDGEGGITRYHYDRAGNLDQMVVGQKLTPAQVTGYQTTPPTLAGLPAAQAGQVLEVTNYTRDAYGKLLTETRVLTGGAQETDQYVYDAVGNLVKVTVAAGGADARRPPRRYDVLGRLTGELSGEGSAALAALGGSPSQAQVDQVWAEWGVLYAYDAAGRLISKTTPNSANAAGDKTVYYYDEDGALRFAINALGEVVEHRYRHLGRTQDTIVYASRISTSGLTGGLVTTALTNAVAAIARPGLDSTTTVVRNADGTIISSTDALGNVTVNGYNAFGERIWQTTPSSSGVINTAWNYDNRGLLNWTELDYISATGAITTQVTYDAFGRVIYQTDANGQTSSATYDRAGRTITTTDRTGKVTAYTYDGRGHTVSITDRNGKATLVGVNAFGRTLTTTTPEGLTTTVQKNAHGDTVQVTDGGGRVTTFTYDKDGNLKTATDAAGATTSGYDKAGRLSFTVDARGSKTSYTYDAASRVLTRKVDDGGLNLVTTYTYDAKGQQVRVTDPAGVITQFDYDQAGNKIMVTVDPDGLFLWTLYTYDAKGRVLTKVDGQAMEVDDRTIHYTYDKAGRLIYETVDPFDVSLTTSYTYDKNGNVTKRADPADGVTRYVYDAEGRLIWTVDPVGAVTRTSYDGEGRLVSTRRYANTVAAATLASWTSATLTDATVSAAVATSGADELSAFTYDGDGRLKYRLDSLSRPTEYVYDGSGNVTTVIEYGAAINAAADYTAAYVQGQINSLGLAGHAQTRVSRNAYDAANRLNYTVDAAGGVTEFTRDGAGNVIRTVRFAAAFTATGAVTTADLQAWAGANISASLNRVSRALYDGAGRAVYALDAENYLTEVKYDAASRIIRQVRYADRYAGVTDATTAAGLAASIGALPASAVATSYQYDKASRLTHTTDANGVVTRQVYDYFGNVAEVHQADGTSAAVTTYRQYDKVGRLTSESKGLGPSAVTRSWTYDGAGNVLTATSGEGAVTSYSYDKAGNQLTETVQLAAGASAVTTRQYDAFGNLVKVSDPRGNVGFFYYDKLNRLTLQVDPEGYGTATTYTIGGEVASVRRYAAKPTGTGSTTVLPTLANGAADSETVFTRDKLDRLTRVTDAEGHYENYTLNSFGDRVSVRNKLGGVTTNVFDKRGQLVEETLPVKTYLANGTEQSQTVVNRFEYDARGNLTKLIQASGLAEQRTTIRAYDKLDRLVSTTFDAVNVINGAYSGTLAYTPVETIKYDQRGNVIETVKAGGARTLFYYDAFDRKIAEISAGGALSAWTYDKADNVKTFRVYETLVAQPANAGGAAPAGSGAYRETTYAYDKNNRLVSTSMAGLRVGQSDGSGYGTEVATATTQRVYDFMGNVLEEIDARGMKILHTYDKLGREIARVDQSNYLTVYTRDAEGNVVSETRYANRTTDPATRAIVADAVNDRTTTFTYDRNGRRLTETRLNVATASVDSASGVMSTTTSNATIAYIYDGLGNITRKTEANGDAVFLEYDALGREQRTWTGGFTDYAGTGVQRETATYRDGLGNVVRTREGKANTAPSGIERITEYTYDKAGHVSTVKDPTGFVVTLVYDAAGNLAQQSYDRQTSAVVNGSAVTVADKTVYRYDAMGRIVLQQSTGANGMGDNTHFQYNAFGELTGRGVTAGNVLAPTYQETFAYDSAGRMWKSNSSDGSARLFVYDKAGNVTLTIASSGAADLGGYASIDAAINGLGYDVFTGAVASNAVAVTYTTYNNRGQANLTIERWRQLSTSETVDRVFRGRSYNAFGEVSAEFDPRAYAATPFNADYGTYFTYNTMGRITQKQGPVVNYTLENGAIQTGRPTENYYYDVSGRLVGSRDANGNLSRRVLLANTGHGKGAEPIVLAEFHAGGTDSANTGVIRYGVDVFGDVRTITNELGYVTSQTFDMAGRVVSVTKPQRAGQSTGLTDYYAYDGLGQRIRHWNNQFGAGYVERTDYDAQGRVTQTIDYAGGVTAYAYAWNASLATSGMGAFGGTTKTTTHISGRTATEQQDYFGRIVARSDLGGHAYSLGFDFAGRLKTQTNTAGQDLKYGYFNTGQVASVTDDAEAVGRYDPLGGERHYSTTTFYGYNLVGNKLSETLQSHSWGWYIERPINPFPNPNPNFPVEEVPTIPEDGETVEYDETRIQSVTYGSWDALGRLTRIHLDVPTIDTTDVIVDYEYDLNGNVRRVKSDYQNQVTLARTSQEYWYRYDSQNRFILTMGSFGGARGSGAITAGATGLEITYDAAGNRASTSRTTYTPPSYVDYIGMMPGYYTATQEFYHYTEDGYLSRVTYAETSTVDAPGATPYVVASGVRVEEARDLLGRVTNHVEYNQNGVVAYGRTATYDERSRVLYDTTQLLQTDNKRVWTTSYYTYNDETAPNSGVYAGPDLGGVVTRTTSSSYTVATNGSVSSQPSTDTKTSYVWWDDAKQSVIRHKPDTGSGTTYTTTFDYDEAGVASSAVIADGQPRNVTYGSSAYGQITYRYVAPQSTPGAGTRHTYLYFDGLKYGEMGNDGPVQLDYAATINRRNYTQTNVFKYGAAQAFADFDQSYDPVNADTPGAASGGYVVQDGDTLQSIAAAMWGDSSLWYLIAEANGLTSASSLVGGMSLIIPNKVANAHNTSETYRPYDPNEALGNVTPSKPKPAAKDKRGCGAAQIFVAIIAVVVAAIVLPHATAWISSTLFSAPVSAAGVGAALGAGSTVVTTVTATGALVTTTLSAGALIGGGIIAGAAGSIISQGVGLAIGAQDKFSWNAVAMAAIAGGVSAGITSVPGVSQAIKAAGGAGSIGGSIVRGVASNVVTQGVAVATGLQKNFDWTNVAVAGVSSGVARWFSGTALASAMTETLSRSATNATAGLVGGVAGVAARSLLEGSNFGDNIVAALPDMIGNTIGNAIADGLAAKSAKNPEHYEQNEQKENIRSNTAPTATVSASETKGYGYYVTTDGEIDDNRYITMPEGREYVPGDNELTPTAQQSGDGSDMVEEVFVIAKRKFDQSRNWLQRHIIDPVSSFFSRSNSEVATNNDLSMEPGFSSALRYDPSTWRTPRPTVKVNGVLYYTDTKNYAGVDRLIPVSSEQKLEAYDANAALRREAAWARIKGSADGITGAVTSLAINNASPETQIAAMNVAASADGMLMAAGSLRSGTPNFMGASRPTIEPVAVGRLEGLSPGQAKQAATPAQFSLVPESYMKPGVEIDMRLAPANSGLNAAGFPRNGPWFWREMAKSSPQYFDATNRALIRAGRSPIVNKAWADEFPSHAGFSGDKLVHHHIDQGPIATPIPEKVHRAWYKALHPNQ
ncbi:hypothetical protein AS593_07585 [Caulobacter vibrioides]|nr:hypothetical protein AS593_07585 [Caulobacter vibrioides]